MTKNFSCNNTTGKRHKGDFYETPYSMTKHILDIEHIKETQTILEPMCGNGAIVKALQAQNLKNVTAYDLEHGIDFFDENKPYDVILTNPAFSVALQTILKAKQIAKEKIILLLPLNYLHGKQRYDSIYNDKEFCLESVNVFTRYPMLGEALREDGKYRTGMLVYAWYVWSKHYKGDPIIRWIDNNNDIIKGS